MPGVQSVLSCRLQANAGVMYRDGQGLSSPGKRATPSARVAPACELGAHRLRKKYPCEMHKFSLAMCPDVCYNCRVDQRMIARFASVILSLLTRSNPLSLQGMYVVRARARCCGSLLEHHGAGYRCLVIEERRGTPAWWVVMSHDLSRVVAG